MKKGEVLAEIETDKATMELESYKNGTLLHIGAQKGEKIPVNGLLCIIGEKGKVDVDAIVAAVKGGMSAVPDVKSQEPVTESSATKPEVASVTTQTSCYFINGKWKSKSIAAAKKLAAEKGIDIKAISGSGDGGRIIKSDIDSYKQSAAAITNNLATNCCRSCSVPVFVAGQEGYTDIPNSQMRSVIAKRLAESKFSAPHFYLTMEINMDNAIAARTQLNEISPAKISFNDLVVKAAAFASAAASCSECFMDG